MGIKGLSTQLRPYACSFTFSKSGNVQNDWKRQNDNDRCKVARNQVADGRTHVIIDGPSLAYYVFHRCLISSNRHEWGFDSYPTYAELGAATLALLDDLEAYGLHIDSIFFDGYLPETKVSTRQERLEKSLLQLKAFRSAHIDPSSISYKRQKGILSRTANTLIDTYSGSRVPNRHSSLPTLPFLVPAIIEALRESPIYGHTIKTVSGEADTFCKIRSEEISPQIILSNDSDLVLLHPHCKVIFFQDLELDAGLGTLRGLYYMPCTVAKQLGCLDLVRLGYELACQPGSSLKECAARLKKNDQFEQDESYRLFSKAYDPGNCLSLGSISSHGELHSVLQRLDPRISEYVLRWLSGLPRRTDTQRMYLPPLVDDPLRASAWRASSSIRRLSYSILASAKADVKTRMAEVDRRGDRIVNEELQLYDILETNEVLKGMAMTLGGLNSDVAATPQNIAVWRLSFLSQLLTMLCDEESGLPPLESVLALFSYPPGRLTWAVLHLHAQLDALHYSFRILAQVLEVRMALLSPSPNLKIAQIPPDIWEYREHSDIDHTALQKIHMVLRGLPSLRDLHTRPGESLLVDDRLEGLSIHVADFYTTSTVDEREDQPIRGQKTRAKKRKTKSGSGGAAKTQQTSKASKNVYSLLEEI